MGQGVAVGLAAWTNAQRHCVTTGRTDSQLSQNRPVTSCRSSTHASHTLLPFLLACRVSARAANDPEPFPALRGGSLTSGGAAARRVSGASDLRPTARSGLPRPLRGPRRPTGGYANTQRGADDRLGLLAPAGFRGDDTGALRASLCCCEKAPLVCLLCQSDRWAVTRGDAPKAHPRPRQATL